MARDARKQAGFSEPETEQDERNEQARGYPGVLHSLGGEEGEPQMNVLVAYDDLFFNWVASKRMQMEQELAALRHWLRHGKGQGGTAKGDEPEFAAWAAQRVQCEAKLRALGVSPEVNWQDAWDWFMAEVVEPETDDEGGDDEGEGE